MIGWLKGQGWLTKSVIFCALTGIGVALFMPLPDGGADYWPFGAFGVFLTALAVLIDRKWWLILLVPAILWPMALWLLIEGYSLIGGEIGPIGF